MGKIKGLSIGVWEKPKDSGKNIYPWLDSSGMMVEAVFMVSTTDCCIRGRSSLSWASCRGEDVLMERRWNVIMGLTTVLVISFRDSIFDFV